MTYAKTNPMSYQSISPAKYDAALEHTSADEACAAVLSDGNSVSTQFNNEDLMNNYKEISEQQYLAWRDVMPVIYFSSVDNVIISNGYAVSEAYDYNDKGVVVKICFCMQDKYYTCYANLKRDSRYVGPEYSYLEYSSGNAAHSVIPVCDDLDAILS